MEYLYQKINEPLKIKDVEFSDESVILIAGPCSVESKEQMKVVAEILKKSGLKFMRAGAFKPRTSPYSFQGLEEEGIKILKNTSQEFGLITVSEVMSTENIPLISENIDILQVGTRNSQNFPLLKELGKINNPVLLKRGFSQKIEEFLLSAEYMLKGGNERIILCERGIRTFETATRFTLDLNAIPVIKKETRLPIIVDPSHGTGRRDLILPMSLASIASGCNGLIVEIHPEPRQAKSDTQQQLNMEEFTEYVEELRSFCESIGKKLV